MKKIGLLLAIALEVFIFFKGALPYSMNTQSDLWIINIVLIIGTVSLFAVIAEK